MWGCLLSSPIPLLFSEASLRLLQITLTQFALSPYERTLRLPTSFFILDLEWNQDSADLPGEILRSLTRSFLLLLFLRRLFWLALSLLLGTCLPSFTVESILSSPCSRSDPPLSRQGAAIAPLLSFQPHDLVLWTDGSVPFPFGKGGSGVLAECSLCGVEATFSFSAGPVCLSFSAETCAILQGLCWSRQHQQVCHFSSPPLWLSHCPRHLVFSSCHE